MNIDEKNRFVIKDFSSKPAFSSFLPGIAGLHGIPLWVFYVNRGQGIASFGFADKNNSIIEFQPANKAYQQNALTGFRTFIKFIENDNFELIEPFSDNTDLSVVQRSMFVGFNEFEIREINIRTGLEISVLYFTLPNETFGALCRKVTVKNISASHRIMELIDGLPVIVPYGINNWALKEMSNTACAWMGVENIANGIPYFRALSSLEDKPDVEEFNAGHFSLCFRDDNGKAIRLPAIVDPVCVFGQNSSFMKPAKFIEQPLSKLLSRNQITRGKMPCSFFCDTVTILPEKEVSYYSIIGRSDDVVFLNKKSDEIFSVKYFEQKRSESKTVIDSITNVIRTETASKEFDLYCRQSYLDNIMRGGIPIIFPSITGQHVYYVYSRKHGDIERDYNFFTIAPEYYSQGNGNFRDVNQNRRNDIRFEPKISSYLIKLFFNALQLDGYNPLVIKGSIFKLPADVMERILSLVHVGDRKKMQSQLSTPFTPGNLLGFIQNHNIRLNIDTESFLLSTLRFAVQEQQAEFGEGYWVDHWTYNLDLLDAYVSVFPDRKDDLFFNDATYIFYDSYYHVKPRNKKYKSKNGKPIQIHSVEPDNVKEQLIRERSHIQNALRNDNGRGEVVYVNLFTKLLALATIKFSTLDPLGIGIEMEAEKPGWYDALNGLPGLFGSSVSETFELQRLLRLLIDIVQEFPEQNYVLPGEVWNLLQSLHVSINTSDKLTPHEIWDIRSASRELFRESVRFGLILEREKINQSLLLTILKNMESTVSAGLALANKLNNGLPPTYLRFEPEHWEEKSLSGNDTFIQILKFIPRVLPLFLEGAVKAMRNSRSVDEARALYIKVKSSGLYDVKLKMYKVNESLKGQPAAIGRTTAFPPGWLENESIFLHMAYKYLLSILQAGLYYEFMTELKHGLIPFQNPEVYGRSILENSSFIASSAHPDSSIHGRGYVARLSGSTAEFLTMWGIMMIGKNPFRCTLGQLEFAPEPVLPGWLFKEEGTLSFNFLGEINVTHHNPSKKDIFPGSDIKIEKIVVTENENMIHEIGDNVITGDLTATIRNRSVHAIDVFYK